MLAFTNANEKTSPTIIGAGCKLTGDIKTNHTVQIHGHVVGNINAETVIIGRGGRVVGRVTANNLFLHGALDGPATVSAANVWCGDNDGYIGISYIEYNLQYRIGM